MGQKIFLILIYTSSITLYTIDLTQYTNKREMDIVAAANGKYSRKMATDITRRYLFAHYHEIPKDRRTEIVHKTLFFNFDLPGGFISSCALLRGIQYQLKERIFLNALEHNDIDTIDKVIKNGINTRSPLIVAIKENRADIIDKLLKATPAHIINDRENLDPILATAIGYRSIDAVNKLLSIPNIDVNASGKYNTRTPLICASYKGLNDIVDRLLQFPDININAKDYRHNTALIAAAYRGDISIVNKLLMMPNIDVNVANIKSDTALMLAKKRGHQAVVDRLLQVPGIRQWKSI